MGKELVKSDRWRLMCDGTIHWIIPSLGLGGHTRIEAGGCICKKGAEGVDAEGQTGKDPAPRSPLDCAVKP